MNAQTPPLRLSVSAQPIREQAVHFEVTARFTNVSATPVCLLSQFEPLPVFFTASLESQSGREVDVAGAGKADFPSGYLEQKELAPGESLDVALDLAQWVRGPMSPGRYTLALTYHNAYGKDCFRGPLTSAPIEIEVTA